MATDLSAELQYATCSTFAARDGTTIACILSQPDRNILRNAQYSMICKASWLPRLGAGNGLSLHPSGRSIMGSASRPSIMAARLKPSCPRVRQYRRRRYPRGTANRLWVPILFTLSLNGRREKFCEVIWLSLELPITGR